MCSCVCHLEAPPFSSAIQQDLRGQRGGGGEPVAELSQGRCSEVNKESLRAILDPCHTGPSSSDHEPEKSGRWGVCVCVLHWIMRTYITDGYATGVSQLTFAFLNGVAQPWWPTLRVFTVFQCFIHWPDGLELLLLCSCLPRSFKKV